MLSESPPGSSASRSNGAPAEPSSVSVARTWDIEAPTAVRAPALNVGHPGASQARWYWIVDDDGSDSLAATFANHVMSPWPARIRQDAFAAARQRAREIRGTSGLRR